MIDSIVGLISRDKQKDVWLGKNGKLNSHPDEESNKEIIAD